MTSNAKTYEEAIDRMVGMKRTDVLAYGKEYYKNDDPQSESYKAHMRECHEMDMMAFIYGIDYIQVVQDVIDAYNRKYDIMDY